MRRKKSRLFALLACLTMLFASQVKAQETDDLQKLIDRVASRLTRAGTPTDIDLSAYSEPRTTTLYIRNGVNVRFVNGTLTRSESLDGPLVEIQGNSRLELATNAALSGNTIRTGNPIVKVEEGYLTIDGGSIIEPYDPTAPKMWTTTTVGPDEALNSDRPVKLTTDASHFIMKKGVVQGEITCDAEKADMQILGGVVKYVEGYHVTTRSDLHLNPNTCSLIYTTKGRRIYLNASIPDSLRVDFNTRLSVGDCILEGDGYNITLSDIDKLSMYYKFWERVQPIPVIIKSSSRRHIPSGYNFVNERIPFRFVLKDNKVFLEEATDSNPIQIIEDVEPGTLPDRIPEAARDIIEELTITGKLNGTDIVLLQDMAKQKLRKLNISGCDIVKGGSAYYTSSGTYATNYFTANDEIGSHMFYQSTSLETVILPNSITKLNGSSFHYGSVKSITIGPKVKTIDGGLCPGANIEEIILNNNSSYILDGGILYDAQRTTIYRAVVGVTGEIIIPNNITTIENSAFDNCSHITKVTLPSNLTEIETACFSDCTALIEVLFNKNLSYLGYDCFGGCSSLKTVDLSNTKVYYIYQSFYGCNAIETLLLPSTIETIWGTCFTSTHLNYISCPAVIPPTLSHADKTFSYSYIKSFCKVVVPTNSITAYKTADGWKNFLKYESDKDPNYIESEDDLQMRLDEIAAENPSKPVTLTIQENGITIKNTIVANEGCKAIITGGKITISKDFSFRRPSNLVRNSIFDNFGSLELQNITIDGNSLFFENSFFNNGGTLTIGNDVKYENIYQGELRYGFYLSHGILNVYSGDLTLNGPIFYPSHGGKVFVRGGNFLTLNSKNIISGDDTVTILEASFSGGPINMRNLNLADMEADGIPDLNVSSINTSNINIYRVMKLPLVNLSAEGVMTLDWHYRVWHSLMEYQGKWRISSEWAKMELERPFVVSGYNDYPMTQDDFNNIEFIDMPNDREAYFDEATKSVKLRLNKDPNYIESEDDLQKRLDEIAAENPSEPVELTIAEEGIDIGFVYASAGCNAKITGGPIRVKNVNNGGDYAYAVHNGAKLTFKDITLDFGNKYQRYATFLVKGDLTIGHDVTFQNIYQGSEQTKGFFVTSNAKLNIYSGDITAYGSIVNSTSESKVYIMGGTLKSTSNDPTITGDASVFMRGGSVIGGNKFVIMVNYVIRISEFAKVKGESGATLIDAKSTYIEGGTLEGSNTYCKSGTIGTPQSVPKVLIDRIYVYGQNIVYGNVDLPMLYMNNDAKIQLASSISKTWTINGDWKQFDITEPYTIVSGYNYYNYTVTKADYSKMQFANLPDDMEAVYNEDLKVVQLQKREVECDLQSLVDGLCDAAPGGNVPAPTDGVDIGCDDAPDPLQCAVDIIIDGGEENVNPNDLKTICLCQAGPDVVIEKPAIRVNPYSTLTISNYNIRSDKYENQSFLVSGTLIIDVNVHIYHFIRFIHIKPGGRVVWRGGHVEDVDEIVYNEGGTLVIEGDFDNGGKCFVNPEGGTLTIKNGSFNGNIENHGTLIIEGGEITGKVDNSGTFTMTGGVVSNTVVNSTEVVFKNYGTFYFKGGIIGGYGSSLIYHAKGAVLRIEGGQFDFSHVTDYWIEAHDDFYIPGNYDFKPTVPMLIEPKVIVRVLYKWIYKFNIVFVGGLPEPRHPLFCGNDFTLTKDHFKFIDWQLPNKRWRWHLNVTDNTIEPRDEEVEDEDDLQAYLNWLAENQQDESASTDANPQVLDLQERIITITEPIVLPVGSHVFFKNGRFAPKSAWSSDRVFYVPSGSSLKMENVVVDMSSSIHYVVSGKTVCRYIFDVAGNLHFGLGCKIKGYVNKNYLPTDTYIPGAALRIAPTAHLYLDGGQIDDVVICVNSVVNIYLTVNLVYNIYFYIPTACRTNGFRILAPYNSYSLTAADMKKLLMFGALEWSAQADAQGYASLYKITYNVGDADGNGEIDIEDASAILNYIIGKPVPESFVLSAADVNKDEKVDILDVTSLIKMLLKKP